MLVYTNNKEYYTSRRGRKREAGFSHESDPSSSKRFGGEIPGSSQRPILRATTEATFKQNVCTPCTHATMGADNSTDASVKPTLLMSRASAQGEWDNEVSRIYESYDKDKDGVLDRDEVIAQSMQLGEKKEVAAAAADAFIKLLGAGDNRITKQKFGDFLARRVIKPGHHGTPYADDVARLRGVFAESDDEEDAPQLTKTGHIKLLRQSSMEFRQKRKQCQICHRQRGASALYSLHGVAADDAASEEANKTPVEDPSEAPPSLVRQTSHDFIKSFSQSICRHSFCPTCIQTHVRDQLKAKKEPLCPVCDEPLVIEDINNLLEEEELVPFLKVCESVCVCVCVPMSTCESVCVCQMSTCVLCSALPFLYVSVSSFMLYQGARGDGSRPFHQPRA
jgi:hypothetical protein